MVGYEYCMVPSVENKKYHNFKAFVGDKVELYLEGGQRVIGVLTRFQADSVILAGGTVVPLVSINDVSVLSRADGRTDWR